MKSPVEMTSDEIRALPRKNVSIEWALKFFARFDDPDVRAITHERLAALGNGAFLGIYAFDEKKNYKRLHLQTIWIKPYELKYRNTKTKDGKHRVGKEMLISNFPLPRGKMV